MQYRNISIECESESESKIEYNVITQSNVRRFPKGRVNFVIFLLVID